MPKKTTAPTTHLFPLWDVEPGDKQDMWANFLESACLLTRLMWQELKRDQPLGAIAQLVPYLSGKPLHELSAAELDTLVTRLRADADRIRREPRAAA